MKLRYHLRLAAALCAMLASMVAQHAAAQDTRIDSICGACVPEKFAKCEGRHFLEGPAFDRQGRLWLTGLTSGALLRVEPNGQCVAIAKPGNAINGSRFDAAGRLILTDAERGLLRYDVATGATQVLRGKNGREMFRGLNDSAVDKSGGIYFTESWGSNVLKPTGRVFYLPADDIETGARDIILVAEGIAFPNGVVLSQDEKDLYVGEYAKNQILKLPLSSPGVVGAHAVPYIFARLVGGTGPDGMAFDSAGNLYAAHYRAGEVVVIDKNGFPVGTIRLPNSAGLGTTNIALHGGYLYITEAFNDEVWRVKTNIQPLLPPNLR